MSEQIVYIVANLYDYDSPVFVQRCDSRAAAERHAAHLNKLLDSDEDEPVFEVREEAVLSEFNP